SGVPEYPRAWIIQTARHKAIDRIRRRARLEDKRDAYVAAGFAQALAEREHDPHEIPDDQLRLIFTCCHPALAPDAQVALTLRTPADVTGLLALMLLHDARREARLDEAGDVVLLEEQDRGRWNKAQIAEALPLVEDALRAGPGPLSLQAAIAALHCQAARPED